MIWRRDNLQMSDCVEGYHTEGDWSVAKLNESLQTKQDLSIHAVVRGKPPYFRGT